MLGGGTFVTQSKVLPGAYINFVSAARASAALSERGIVTMPLILDWGPQDTVMDVSDFPKNSLPLFGYDYTAPRMAGLRDLFKNIRVAYLYRLGSGGVKASNIYATALYTGTRGNDLKVVIAENAKETFDVSLYLGTVLIDFQTVLEVDGLVDNDFVTWNPDAELTPTAGIPLAGGASPIVSNTDYQTYLDLMEGYSFNAIGCPSADPGVKNLFVDYTKRMRDEQGVKFQCVAFDCAADHEGVVNVMNRATDTESWSAVYWATGVIAGTAVNRSALNRVYDGGFNLDVKYTQTQLEDAIKGGRFAFHRVGPDIRVLSDLNSLVTLTDEKGDVFKENQTIRVIDQIANDIAVLFNTKYLGVIPNDASGRVSLWADIVKHHQQLQTLRAIEDFDSEDVKVEQGGTKRSVVISDVVTVVNAMAQLYMTCIVA